MAGDWIKIEKATARKPEILRMSELLSVTPDRLVCFGEPSLFQDVDCVEWFFHCGVSAFSIHSNSPDVALYCAAPCLMAASRCAALSCETQKHRTSDMQNAIKTAPKQQ